jgi:hypothetical protein
VEEVLGKRLRLGLPVHRTKLLTQLVPDIRRGPLVCLQKAGSGRRLALVGLAHAWELLSQAPVPEATAISVAEFEDTHVRLKESLMVQEAVDPVIHPSLTVTLGRSRSKTISFLMFGRFPVDSILLAIYALSAFYMSRGIDDRAAIRGSHQADTPRR